MTTLMKALRKCISNCFTFRKKKPKKNPVDEIEIKQESPEKQPIEAEIEIEDDTKIEIEDDTKIEIEDDSKIEIEDDTKIEIEDDSEIEIEADSEIEIEDDSKIEIEDDSKIEIEADTKIEIEDDTKIEIEDDSKIEIEADTEIEIEADTEIEIEADIKIEIEASNEVNSKRETTIEAKRKRETAKKPNVYCADCVSRQKKCFEDLVKTAVAKNKVFWTDYKVVTDFESGLISRGWVKKNADTFNAGPNKTIFRDPTYGHKIISRYNIQPSFVLSRSRFQLHLLKEDQITNHFYRMPVTTKIGLCKALRRWCFSCDENPNTFFPRCYAFNKKNEKRAFIDDFSMTAACGILKWVLRTNGKSLQDEVIPSNHGHARMVPEDIIVTALVACQFHLYYLTHEDEDKLICAGIVDREQFISDYYQVMHHGAHIQNSEKYVECCHQLLCKLRRVNPQLDIDGEKNIWILKPRALSRGRGIHCKNDMEDICSYGNKWVVQKYIERPLLVYGTKIDLRQHFLITDWNPLTIWFYKHSLIRFSSQLYTLEHLDIAIHVCNNAIQRKLKNAPNRHPNLPEENLWHSDEFKEYLCTIGKEQVWDSIIIPGMKKAFIHTMKVSQKGVKYKKNSFDLVGADFLFGENFQPWLLEIQYKPGIKKDTSGMEQLVPPMVEDILRVVIDYKEDPNCNLGGFELIYKQANYTGNGILNKEKTFRDLKITTISDP